MLDVMTASALKKLLTHVHIRKRVSVEEQRAQKYDRFLRRGKLHTWSMSIFEPPELWSCTGSIRFVQFSVARWRCSGFRYKMGSSTIIREWNAYGIDCIGSVWTGEYSKEWTTVLFQTADSGKATYWSSPEDKKLQSSERNCGKRYSNQESQREENQRWEESGRMLSAESKGTMFERRFM